MPPLSTPTLIRQLRQLVAHTVVTCAALTALVSSAAAQDDGRRVAGSVRAGAEYDDNVFRLEGDGREGGFLSRYFAALDLATRATAQSSVSASLSHGGKFFFDNEQGAADTLLSQVALGYRHRLTEPLGLWVQADLRDRTERVLKRDYATGGASGGVEAFLGPLSLRVGGGGRFFAFKPNPEASSSNAEGLANASVDVGHGLSLSLGYSAARRAFDTDRFRREDEDVIPVDGELRRDVFHVGQIGAGYRSKRVVAELAYAYSLNTSNSFGQGLRRHALNLTVTAPLPWRLFASLHAELQRTTYDDPVRIDATFLVDEDNRNAGVLSLVRAIGEHWEIEGRYSLYLQEFGVGGNYSRQTFFLAAAYVFE